MMVCRRENKKKNEASVVCDGGCFYVQIHTEEIRCQNGGQGKSPCLIQYKIYKRAYIRRQEQTWKIW